MTAQRKKIKRVKNKHLHFEGLDTVFYGVINATFPLFYYILLVIAVCFKVNFSAESEKIRQKEKKTYSDFKD